MPDWLIKTLIMSPVLVMLLIIVGALLYDARENKKKRRVRSAGVERQEAIKAAEENGLPWPESVRTEEAEPWDAVERFVEPKPKPPFSGGEHRGEAKSCNGLYHEWEDLCLDGNPMLSRCGVCAITYSEYVERQLERCKHPTCYTTSHTDSLGVRTITQTCERCGMTIGERRYV